MTITDKELLYKDIYARLPYNVKAEVTLVNKEYDRILGNESTITIDKDFDECLTLSPYQHTILGNLELFSVKPYLRSMSSMTEEEERELNTKFNYSKRDPFSIRYHSEGYWDEDTTCDFSGYLFFVDWLNAHHFDYRGLIEKGLVIEVTKENNPYEEKNL